MNLDEVNDDSTFDLELELNLVDSYCAEYKYRSKRSCMRGAKREMAEKLLNNMKGVPRFPDSPVKNCINKSLSIFVCFCNNIIYLYCKPNI